MREEGALGPTAVLASHVSHGGLAKGALPGVRARDSELADLKMQSPLPQTAAGNPRVQCSSA
jgi:hypothetical protein